MTRVPPSAIAALGALIALAAAAETARAVSLYAGVGPRFRDGAVDAVGTTHVSVAVGRLFDVTLDVSGYLGGPQPQGLSFAGASLGVLFRPPIPGPVGVESGLAGGVIRRTEARHGVDDTGPAFTWESALTTGLGPARLRLGYSRALGAEAGAMRRSLGQQVMLMVGFSL